MTASNSGISGFVFGRLVLRTRPRIVAFMGVSITPSTGERKLPLDSADSSRPRRFAPGTHTRKALSIDVSRAGPADPLDKKIERFCTASLTLPHIEKWWREFRVLPLA